MARTLRSRDSNSRLFPAQPKMSNILVRSFGLLWMLLRLCEFFLHGQFPRAVILPLAP